jgi:hypothetical protein
MSTTRKSTTTITKMRTRRISKRGLNPVHPSMQLRVVIQHTTGATLHLQKGITRIRMVTISMVTRMARAKVTMICGDFLHQSILEGWAPQAGLGSEEAREESWKRCMYLESWARNNKQARKEIRGFKKHILMPRVLSLCFSFSFFLAYRVTLGSGAA